MMMMMMMMMMILHTILTQKELKLMTTKQLFFKGATQILSISFS